MRIYIILKNFKYTKNLSSYLKLEKYWKKNNKKDNRYEGNECLDYSWK